eukprot:308466-Chlamydomonas_euryale.AAC.8
MRCHGAVADRSLSVITSAGTYGSIPALLPPLPGETGMCASGRRGRAQRACRTVATGIVAAATTAAAAAAIRCSVHRRKRTAGAAHARVHVCANTAGEAARGLVEGHVMRGVVHRTALAVAVGGVGPRWHVALRARWAAAQAR